MNFDGFVGSAYSAAATLQDNQKSINYFVEIDRNEGAKVPKALLSAPGLLDLGQSTYAGAVRGMYVLKGGVQALAVISNSLILITTNSSTLPPSFTYKKVGSLNSFTGPVAIRDNGVGGVASIVDGANMYVYNISAQTLYTSTDPALLGSNQVCEIDGWFVYAQPNSQVFYVSPVYWDGKTTSPFDATYYALKDDAHDNIVAMIENNRELWLIGSETTEVWYNAGGNYFPFSRLQGTMQQIGCAATYSVARHSHGLMWLGRSERGNNQVFMIEGYIHKNIANPALAYALNQYAVISDAIGYVYSEEGHEFYVLIFPTANATWVYDITTEEWHQRASFDPAAGVFNRQRANCIMNFGNTIVAGDYSTGQIYQQSRQVYADGSYPLVSVRRAPHLWDKENRARIRYTRLQVEFKPGGASQTGTYTNPQASLAWSDDGGQTFGNQHLAPIGVSGDTKNRTIWRRLGIARDRVFEVSVSDPVNRDITGASVMGQPYKT